MLISQGWGMQFHTGTAKLDSMKDGVFRLPFNSSLRYFSALGCPLCQIRKLPHFPQLVHAIDPTVPVGSSRRAAQKKPRRLSYISEVLKIALKSFSPNSKISSRTLNPTTPSPKHPGPSCSPTPTYSPDSGEAPYSNSWHRCAARQRSSTISLPSSLRLVCLRI